MKRTNQDAKEFEMLLGEISHATLPPLHLEEFHSVNNTLTREKIVPLEMQDSGRFPDPKAYEEFYQGYYGIKNIFLSSSGNMPTYSGSSNGCLNKFYSRLSFDSSSGLDSTQLPKDQRSEFKPILHEHDNMEHEEERSSLSMHENGVAFPPRHCFVNDQALASAFANITFKDNSPTNPEIEIVNSNEILDGRNSGHLAGACSAIPFMAISKPEPFIHASHSQSPEVLPDTMNHPSTQATMSASFQMHGVKYPIHLKGNNANTKEMDMIFNQNAYGAVCANNIVGKCYDHSEYL